MDDDKIHNSAKINNNMKKDLKSMLKKNDDRKHERDIYKKIDRYDNFIHDYYELLDIIDAAF